MKLKNKIMFLGSVIAIFFLFGCTPEQNTVMSNNQAYKTGLIYVKKNDIPKAKEYLQIAIQDKSNSKAFALLAMLSLDEKSNSSEQENEQAYQLLQTALQNDEPLAYLGMYYYYKKKNDSKQSELWLNKSVDKNISIANYLKAKQLLEKNNNDIKGMALLKKAAIQNYSPALGYLVLRSIKAQNKVETYIWTTVISLKIPNSEQLYSINTKLKDRVTQELDSLQKINADNQVSIIVKEMDANRQNLF